ncbi:cilia- and flagella-associated protein 44 isoform X1 [Rhinoderma darwinii]|uniref:cilia- and flagella-associated protein 44 isoform X1 n=1 Tax=Rhinoderma darwinii TaxID=43563 RepID=UPI003F661DA0
MADMEEAEGTADVVHVGLQENVGHEDKTMTPGHLEGDGRGGTGPDSVFEEIPADNSAPDTDEPHILPAPLSDQRSGDEPHSTGAHDIVSTSPRPGHSATAGDGGEGEESGDVTGNTADRPATSDDPSSGREGEESGDVTGNTADRPATSDDPSSRAEDEESGDITGNTADRPVTSDDPSSGREGEESGDIIGNTADRPATSDDPSSGAEGEEFEDVTGNTADRPATSDDPSSGREGEESGDVTGNTADRPATSDDPSSGREGEESVDVTGNTADRPATSDDPSSGAEGEESGDVTGNTADRPATSDDPSSGREGEESGDVTGNTADRPATSDDPSSGQGAETVRESPAEEDGADAAGEEPVPITVDTSDDQNTAAPPEDFEEHPNSEDDEEEVEETEKIPDDFFYDYDSICSQPYISPGSGIPRGVLHLLHSFGYDCTKRANLQLLDEQTLLYVAGTTAIILGLKTQEQRYLRSSSGRGIGAVAVHPSRNYFAVAEKGHNPNIILYEFPSLKPYRMLRGGTVEAFAFIDFNMSGTLLASVGSSPDYMLTIWDWKQEKTMLRSKAFSQDVFQVTFSPENEEQLTTCGTGHIRFWKMARTFTGLKLQGEIGRFGKTALTDIEGYVALPDGKVISGSEWGNMLLWEGGLIKVEICRRGRRSCHNGPINQFVLDEGELITIGADGFVRVWDFETVDTADSVDDTGLLEMEPMNELMVGKNVNLRYMVKTMDGESPVWFAQDGSGGIWKLDLSFSNITQDPECLFSCHSGTIKALDASPSTYLMATTSLDRSLRIYDFVGKTPLVDMKFKQGGTALTWAPRMVNPKGGLFAVGFEDGVVRILEVYNATGMRLMAGRGSTRDAAVNLKQAFKPHNAPVTALAYERNGEILATGSMDRTVFFFAVGDVYEPMGFVRLPGAVRELHWSPPSHEQSALLVLCENGFAVQIPAPAPEKMDLVLSYEIFNLPLSYFRFSSIKSKIEREEQLERIRKNREQKSKEREAWIQQQKERGVELSEDDLLPITDDEEEKLPELYVPKDPSPILCGFYASPGTFWLSLDGYDSGFLYLCKFSEGQTGDPTLRRDEPVCAVPIENTSSNPIHKVHFSSNKQLLFCGMEDGAVRVYPLQTNDPSLDSMSNYWSLGVHDNQYGAVQAISSSFDNQYLVTCGADGNIFCFSILSMEDIERDLRVKKAEVPSPRVSLDKEKPAEDIEDPSAYSIENAKQKRQSDLLMTQAEKKKAGRRRELQVLRDQFRQLLKNNMELPNHMQLGRTEFEMDHRIREEMERQTSERIRTVLKELAWEQERHNIGLKKLQARFRDKVEFDTVIVRAINTEHEVSTYRLLSLSEKYYKVKGMIGKRRMTRYDLYQKESDIAKESRDLATTEADEPSSVTQHRQQWRGRRTEGRMERIRKILEKTEKAKSKILQRRQEWDELYKTKPSEDYEDPADVLAIKNAMENMGDFKLKTAKDYTVPEHLRINAERKRNELAMLESMIHEHKSSMNRSIMALRDLKLETIEKMERLVRELIDIQEALDPSKHLPIPRVPSLLPDETPEKKFQYDSETLRRFQLQQEKRVQARPAVENGGFGGFGSFGGKEQTAAKKSESHSRPSTTSTFKSHRIVSSQSCRIQNTELSDLEKEAVQREEIQNLYMQENLIKQMNKLASDFDAELRLLRHKKLQLDVQMKMADLRHITLFEELLLLKEFEKREDILQEKVSDRITELDEMNRRSEDFMQLLEAKRKEVVKLQEKEKALHAAFQTSLGEGNKFATFLTKVFKKKIKRVKKKEARGDEEEDEDSDEDSDEESTYESDDEELESEEGVFDDSVCPDNCDPELFDNILQLREKRLDIEEALVEEKKIMDNLKKECDTLAKKVRIVEVNLKTAEAELEAFQREKQQKLNELHVVVPMKLHQVEYVINGEIPSDLSQALVFTNQSLEGLQHRIRELQMEKVEQRELYKKAKEQHKQLIREKKEMESKIQSLEEKCRQQMMMKFGRLVDLEALQTLSVNTGLEELKMKSAERQEEMDREIAEWKIEVMETKRSLMEITREQTKKLERLNELLVEKKTIEAKLDARQTAVGEEFQGPRKADIRERQKLLELVQMQSEEIRGLKEEILLLSRKGGNILPPAQSPAAHSTGTLA